MVAGPTSLGNRLVFTTGPCTIGTATVGPEEGAVVAAITREQAGLRPRHHFGPLRRPSGATLIGTLSFSVSP